MKTLVLVKRIIDPQRQKGTRFAPYIFDEVF